MKTELPNFLDSFILQERLPGGHTVVEHFVDAHPELPEEERAMLLGWRDVVEGIFEVKSRDGEALIVVNVLDELTYRVRSNMGPAVFRQTPPGVFILARLVPIEDEWLVSGTATLQPAAARADIYRVVAELRHAVPGDGFPQSGEAGTGVGAATGGAWPLYRVLRHGPGGDPGTRAGQTHARLQPVPHAPGAGRRGQNSRRGRAGAVRRRTSHDFQLGRDLIKAKTVGVIFDEVDGLNLFANFGLLDETFADPSLAAKREHRQEVLAYLEDREISPLPLRRLAERIPERASKVFQQVLKQPKFSWQRDGEALLRRYKPHSFEKPPLPSFVIMNNPLAAADIIAAETPPSQSDRRRRWVR